MNQLKIENHRHFKQTFRFFSSLLLRALDSKICELFILSVVIDSVRLAAQQTYYPFHFNAVVITVYNCSMKGFRNGITLVWAIGNSENKLKLWTSISKKERKKDDSFVSVCLKANKKWYSPLCFRFSIEFKVDHYHCDKSVLWVLELKSIYYCSIR